jgi:hypothetical protein
MFGDDPYKCGIIEEVQKKEGPNGKGDMLVTIKGRECKAFFERRYVQPPSGFADYTAYDHAETVLKTMVALQLGSTAITARKINNFETATDTARGATYTLNTRWKLLSEIATQISTATGLGHFVYLDLTNKHYVYDVSEGVDRRSTQSTNGRAIFSSDYDTIENATITKSNVKKKNLIYSAGQGVGDDRIIRTVYDTTEPTGVERKEYFYDYKTLSAIAEIDNAGAAKLVELSTDTYIDGSALTYSQLVLGVDYNLGDLVTVETYGETIHPRIVGVTESWAPSSYKIKLTYDRNYPEFDKQVASIMSDQGRLNNATEGTVIESSSNSNGYYQKFSDGTMIVRGWGYGAFSNRSYFTSSITLPVSFTSRIGATPKISTIGYKTSVPVDETDVTAASGVWYGIRLTALNTVEIAHNYYTIINNAYSYMFAYEITGFWR